MEKKPIINLLKKLVKINSIYPNEKKLGSFLYDFFIKKGFFVEKQFVEKDRFNLLVKKGKAKQSILLYAHLDTVDSTNKNWQTNPFQLIIKNDKGYGLGAFDMKGGMAANILSFLETNLKNWNLKLAFCVDEENISKGAYRLIKSSFLDDVKIILSTEPAFYYGNQGIVIGRPGRAVYQLLLSYPSIHYGLYDHKNDIALILSQFIQKIKKLNHYKKHSKQFLFIREIKTETIGLSTINKIYLEIDSSIVSPDNQKTVETKLNQLLLLIKKNYPFLNYQLSIKPRETPYLDGYFINKKNNHYLKILEKAISQITQKKAVPYFRSSIADENLFGYYGFNVFGIGSDGGNAHNGNEWISLSSLVILKKIIIHYLKKLDKSIIYNKI